MASGLKTTSLPTTGLLVEVLGNAEIAPGVLQTVRRTIAQLGAQLASTGNPVGDQLAAIAAAAGINPAVLQNLANDMAALRAAGNQAVAEINAAKAMVAAESTARSEFDQLLVGEIGRISPFSAGRPGEIPSAFTSGLVGSRPPALDPTSAVSTASGKAYPIADAGMLALRSPIWIEPDIFHAARVAFLKLEDNPGPEPGLLDVGIQWLDVDYRDAGQSLIRRYEGLKRQDGPQYVTVRVPSSLGAVPIIRPPENAVSWRPYLRSYGAGGLLAVETMSVTDVTYAGVYAPDVTDIAAQLATIKGIIEAGLPLTTPILPSYPVADLPAPGTPGRKAFATDGRAPNAAGTLEAANSGTGVEVTDNGIAWVISGTNQQVQA